MSNTIVKEKAKKTKTVAWAYIEDRPAEKDSQPSSLKIENNSKINVLARKTAKMKAILAIIPLPAGK